MLGGKVEGGLRFHQSLQGRKALLDWADVGLYAYGELFGLWIAVRIGYYSNPVGFMMALVTMALICL